MARDEYLIARLPPVPGILSAISAGSQVVVRFMYSGGVFRFHSNVINYVKSPEFMVFLSFPTAIETIELRKAQRLESLLPCAADIAGIEYWGVVLDLSMGGCRLSMEPDEGDLPTIQLGREITLYLHIPGVAEHQVIQGKVKNIRQDPRIAEIGVEFDNSHADSMQNIGAYVKTIAKSPDSTKD